MIVDVLCTNVPSKNPSFGNLVYKKHKHVFAHDAWCVVSDTELVLCRIIFGSYVIYLYVLCGPTEDQYSTTQGTVPGMVIKAHK